MKLDARDDALEEAREALKARAMETDTASPEGHRARIALATINALLEQRGCEHFDRAVEDGRLVTLCDVIVFG